MRVRRSLAVHSARRRRRGERANGTAVVTLPAETPPHALCGLFVHATREEMVERATAIAVVEIRSTEEVSVKGGHWTYSESADARIEEVIKGELPARFLTLHGQENFICARVDWKPGRFLVFLAKDGDLWVGSNWHLSALPIVGETVEWPEADSRALKSASLLEALAEIRRAKK